VRNSHFNHPLFGYYDTSFESADFADRLDYTLAIVGKGKFSKQFSFDTTKRRYFCPHCKLEYESNASDYENKWGFLSPHASSYSTLQCLNCRRQSEVTRFDCIHDGCKGNVLSKIDELAVCLTCGFELEEYTV